jgi:hypothetical protein
MSFSEGISIAMAFRAWIKLQIKNWALAQNALWLKPKCKKLFFPRPKGYSN